MAEDKYPISPRLKRFTNFSDDDLSQLQKHYLDNTSGLEVADYDHEGTIILVPPDWNDPNTPSPMPVRVRKDGTVV